MPRPSKRTRSKRRTSKRLPGGGRKVHYNRLVNTPKLCHICKQPLTGIRQTSPSDTSKLNRSKRRVWRPYGGQVCHNCLKNSLKQAARNL